MRAREVRNYSIDQLQQAKQVLEADLLGYVAGVAANATEGRQRRVIRKDLARVLTLLKQRIRGGTQ